MASVRPCQRVPGRFTDIEGARERAGPCTCSPSHLDISCFCPSTHWQLSNRRVQVQRKRDTSGQAREEDVASVSRRVQKEQTVRLR